MVDLRGMQASRRAFDNDDKRRGPLCPAASPPPD